MNYDVIVNLVDNATGGLGKLESNLNSLDRKSNRLAGGLKNVGGKMVKFGKIASVAGAGLATAVGGMFVLAQQSANAGTEISRAARVAGVGVEEFQQFAYAAGTLGIEQDKLSDILKDVNDKFGDFAATGAGPLADFFENIAPKVGVTADQFARLSGPEALQLYVKSLQDAGLSQQEMTFYMEALASDATALLPLLQNNAAGLNSLSAEAQRLGIVLSGETIAAAEEFAQKSEAMRLQLGAIVGQIGHALIPVFNDLLVVLQENVVPAIKTIIENITGLISWFQQLPAPVREAAGVIAFALGAGGPVILAIGALSLALSTLIAASGPIGLFIAAAAALYAAWKVWGDDITALFNAVVASIGESWLTFKENLATIKQIFVDTWNGIIEYFRTLPAQFIQLGADIINGLIQGIRSKLDALREATGFAGQEVTDEMRDRMLIRSPSRVFAEIGQQLMAGMSVGIQEGKEDVISTVGQTGNDIIGATDSWGSQFVDALSQGLEDGKLEFQDFRDFALKSISDIVAAQFTDGPTGSLFGGIASSIAGLFFDKGGQIKTGGYGIVGENGAELVRGPANVTSRTATSGLMRRGGGDGGGDVYAPTISVTVQGGNGSPEQSKELGKQISDMVEAKVTDTMIKYNNRSRGGLAGARRY